MSEFNRSCGILKVVKFFSLNFVNNFGFQKLQIEDKFSPFPLTFHNYCCSWSWSHLNNSNKIAQQRNLFHSLNLGDCDKIRKGKLLGEKDWENYQGNWNCWLPKWPRDDFCYQFPAACDAFSVLISIFNENIFHFKKYEISTDLKIS